MKNTGYQRVIKHVIGNAVKPACRTVSAEGGGTAIQNVKPNTDIVRINHSNIRQDYIPRKWLFKNEEIKKNKIMKGLVYN